MARGKRPDKFVAVLVQLIENDLLASNIFVARSCEDVAKGYEHVENCYEHVEKWCVHVEKWFVHVANCYVHVVKGYVHVARSHQLVARQNEPVALANVLVAKCHAVVVRRHVRAVRDNELASPKHKLEAGNNRRVEKWNGHGVNHCRVAVRQSRGADRICRHPPGDANFTGSKRQPGVKLVQPASRQFGDEKQNGQRQQRRKIHLAEPQRNFIQRP